jgi:HEAT repeat protein
MDAAGELWELYQRETSEEVKEQMLQAFMIAGDDEHLLEVARDRRATEELRGSAIQLLGAEGAEEALWRLYQEESSLETKKRILHALFVAGDHVRIAEVASDKSQPLEIRKAAIHNLGISGEEAVPALLALYRSETDRDVKERVIEALFINDAANELIEIARAESDPELKKRAVEKISLIGSKEAKDFLLEILRKK